MRPRNGFSSQTICAQEVAQLRSAFNFFVAISPPSHDPLYSLSMYIVYAAQYRGGRIAICGKGLAMGVHVDGGGGCREVYFCRY